MVNGKAEEKSPPDLNPKPLRGSASFSGTGSHGCDFDIEPVCLTRTLTANTLILMVKAR
jgi:hypothetical protein